ncbi:YgaP family membrane protein [Priestia koreensis]|uniref:Inner membrane protein YgaP-like transmembrane domain-containing protein n=1 Tax=Priestia koreensis TaxID=284581 RepID=A0A0M0KQY1_9BACI|nr:DUF2892 domain-containing protein [Priestia koreensis]KOO41229.1 hypothetical protein AMD01_20035 [Priestia koreensis]MCM3005920.1 DUF2892 domain-containing protein [Priestia koreensis]UNL85253.1 DUF2892 domain-containing protein [Priestia koreensis]
MKQNIGTLNALIRITLGFTVLAWSIARLSRRPYKQSHLVYAMLGGMKIAEGFTRFCPLTYAYDKSQEKSKADEQPYLTTYNPS